MKKLKLTPLIALFFLSTVFMVQGALAQEESPPDTVLSDKPAPPTSVAVVDKPNDDGHAVLVQWEPSPDDGLGRNNVVAYEIYRFDEQTGEHRKVGITGAGIYEYKDGSSLRMIGSEPNPDYIAKGRSYSYSVKALSASGITSDFSSAASGIPLGNWYHTGKTSYLVAIIIFFGLVTYFINSAKKGKELYIRPLGGIKAIDDAIGRATEMGRPILFVLGTGTAADLATIAGYTILSRVAKKTAEYQIPVIVPVNDPVMMAVAQETVRSAYMEAGRPDLYDDKNIPYLTAMQFPFVAAVIGLMIREKPATIFYMGVFHAESLLLAETGTLTGAIQISGTDQVAQLPFFIAATDFTLIGEELYAASAYLSKQPLLMGPLKAQDYMKGILIVLVLLGLFTLTFGWTFIADLLKTSIT